MSALQLNEQMNEVDSDDQHFRKILLWVVGFFLILSIVLPYLPVFDVERKDKEKIPPRIAKVLMEKKKVIPLPPPPAPTTKKSEPEKEPLKKKVEPKKAKKKIVPKVKKKEAVQKRVAKVGLLALRSQLMELRDDPILNRISRKDSQLSKNVSASTRPTKASVAKNVTRGSGGIDTAKLSKVTTQTALASRKLTKVTTHIKAGDDRKLGDKNIKGRSLESIRLAIERIKGSLQTIYMRQLRKTPGIQGRVLFELIIAPSGKVIKCRVVESELKSSRLERKFVIKLKSINFGEEDVGDMKIMYPLDFFPSLSGR